MRKLGNGIRVRRRVSHETNVLLGHEVSTLGRTQTLELSLALIVGGYRDENLDF